MADQIGLNAFKADFESGGPPYNAPSEVIATMHRATAAEPFRASGQAARAEHAGDRFPDFVLDDPDGHPVQSGRTCRHGNRWSWSFYRGVWCPDCNSGITSPV